MSNEPAKRLTPDLVTQYAQQMRVGPEDYMRLLETFLSRNGERLAELRSALANRDLESAQRVAHSMKGTALTLRLSRMAQMAERLEDALRSGSVDDLDGDVRDLEEELLAIAADADSCR